MLQFQLQAPFEAAGDQPEAIRELVEASARGGATDGQGEFNALQVPRPRTARLAAHWKST